MYSFSDNSKAAQKYRLHQMIANQAISGIETHPDDIAQLERWIDEEVPQDEVARRLTVKHIGGDTTAKKVENLRRYYKIKKVKGSDTVSLIADLIASGILTIDKAGAFRQSHISDISKT
ncbi:hypothetical protein [Agrobacterium sp.]|uniref:hypothetical protein n=1 Tax=Agrobacterium sp. TaxID=361 RepID=UPI0028A1BF08|nr:hypothetical protein [Agrobacterium sp.]